MGTGDQTPAVGPAAHAFDRQVGRMQRHWVKGVACGALFVAFVALFFALTPNPVELPEFTGTPAVDAQIASVAEIRRGEDRVFQTILWTLGAVITAAAVLGGINYFQNRWASDRERVAVLKDVYSFVEDRDPSLATQWNGAIRQATEEIQSSSAVRTGEVRNELKTEINDLTAQLARSLGTHDVRLAELLQRTEKLDDRLDAVLNDRSSPLDSLVLLLRRYIDSGHEDQINRILDRLGDEVEEDQYIDRVTLRHLERTLFRLEDKYKAKADSVMARLWSSRDIQVTRIPMPKEPNEGDSRSI